jgi:DNA-directed RNA polymerase specialized sigma24 family protein
VAIDRLRSQRPSQYTGDGDIGFETIADPLSGPDLIAEARSDMAAVDRALRQLPDRHQAIMVALRIDEPSRLEVAVHHGISLRRVDTLLPRHWTIARQRPSG